MKKKPVVKLIGEDGNAFYIMGKVVKAMKMSGYSQDEIKEYQTKAMSGDYDHLLATTMDYVDVR